MTRPQRMSLLIGLTLALNTSVFAQAAPSSSQRDASAGRIYTLHGEFAMIAVDGSAPAHTFFDLILYARGNEAFARQRVRKGGRYSFNNVPEGNYNLAIELDNVEIARVGILVAQRKDESLRQDLALHWSSALQPKRDLGPAPDSYTRTNQNRALYERAMKEINRNELPKATATLRSLVEADPKDFLAWSELATLYFIQKNFAAAETSYAKAIELRPDFISAFVSFARVRLAQNNNEGAIAVLESALKADPKSAVVNFFLGEAYLALKKDSMAVTHLN